MTTAPWKALAAALGLAALGLLGGCSGSTTCSSDSACAASESCNAATSSCEPKCLHKTCPAGLGCRATTGQCADLCSGEGAPQCAQGQVCDATTGACVDKCAGVTCSLATLACNPANGQCEPKCKPSTCQSDEKCEPTTGTCTKYCASPKRPMGASADCPSGQKCQDTSGKCVALCDGVLCQRDYQWCDEATGLCTNGKSPAGYVGSTCAQDSDCKLVGVHGAGQKAKCLQAPAQEAFSGGYCTVSCDGGQDCPAGSACTPQGCVDICLRDSECAGTNNRCVSVENAGIAQDGLYVCLPSEKCTKANAADCGAIGADCQQEGDCADGDSCYPETVPAQNGQPSYDTGFVAGYCLRYVRATDSCPAGSVLAPAGGASDAVCLKRCSGAQIGDCNQGEQCALANQRGDLACGPGECVTDAQCEALTARCTGNQLQYCGRGQQCANIDHQTGLGSCSVVDTCSQNNPCPAGKGTCDLATGLCAKPYCDAAAATCRRGRCAADAECAAGTTCNTQSGRCERTCQSDAACGKSAWCQIAEGATSGLCVARCTAKNKNLVCKAGEACYVDSGQCKPKCTTNESCGTGGTCEVSTGLCTYNNR